MPNINVPVLALIIVVVANFLFGFLWYTPLFGKAWARELKFDMNTPPPKGALIKGMVFMIIGNFLMAYVFAHNIAAWNPVSWGLPPAPVSPVNNALMASLFTWAGFFLPVDLSAVAWEGKSWKLFFINTGYHLGSLLIAAFILVYMMW